jgi:hypothetical protein
MAGRIRSIKPELLDDELAAGLSDAAWRLWISSWLLADDYGNARAGEKYLAAQVWHDTSKKVARPLGELIEKGFVEPYSCDGQRYVHIRGWTKHQRIDNAGKARMPAPDSDDGEWKQALGDILAKSRRQNRESPRVADVPASSREIPLARAPAHSGGQTTTPISIPTPTPEGDRARAPRAPETTPPSSGFSPGARHDASESYAEEARKLTSAGVWGFTNYGERKVVANVVETYAPPNATADARRAWIATALAEWQRVDPVMSAGFPPLKFGDWLRAGRKPRESKFANTGPTPIAPPREQTRADRERQDRELAERAPPPKEILDFVTGAVPTPKASGT